MGEELLKSMANDIQVYLGDTLIGNMASLKATTNIESSTFTMKDMECAYSLINHPREASFTFDNSKVDQFQLAQLFGMKIIETEIIKGYKQVKTHKKKRINKKWLKRYGTYPIYDDNCYMINGTLIGSPKVINALRESCKVS